MSDLRELYQEVILDHNRQPRNFRVMPDADHHAHGHNPLCGDQIEVFLHIENGVVADVSFQGSGCAISKASASLMTTAVKGKTVAEAEELFHRFQEMITAPVESEPGEALGKLTVFAGVREFPARVKCAGLAWHTLHNALNSDDKVASTE
jgi:nitrogen fixation NifU-like protein